jgi:hypothetical protein
MSQTFDVIIIGDDGRVLNGATEDEWGYPKKITPDGLALLGAITRNILPC